MNTECSHRDKTITWTEAGESNYTCNACGMTKAQVLAAREARTAAAKQTRRPRLAELDFSTRENLRADAARRRGHRGY